MSAPNRIRELRGDRSLDWLAEQSGVARNSINQIERGMAELTLDKMRKLAPALGVRPSALLNDEDVELRLGPHSKMLMEALREIPAADHPSLAWAAAAIIKIAKQMALKNTNNYFDGEPEQVGHLSSLWNSMTPESRARAITMLDATGFGETARRFSPPEKPRSKRA